MTYLNGIVGRIQTEYCQGGEEEIPVSVGLTNLLNAVKDRAYFNGTLNVPNFVYIVGDLQGTVVSTPRVATNNPALNPILWNSPA